MSSFFHSDQHQAASRQSIIPPRQTFSFPTMKTDEILSCLKELGIEMTQHELANPDENKGAIRGMLELLAEICTGIPRDEMYQPAFEGLKAFSYPGLHDDSVPQLNLFRACTKMMDVCGVQDFTIKDFISPTAPRLKRQLSGIINFAKFREERYIVLGELNLTRSGLVEEHKELTEKNYTLNNRLSLLREQTNDESEMINRLEAENKEMAEKMDALVTLQMQINSETEDLQHMSDDLKQHIVQETEKLAQANIKKSKLASQIVTSPEKFRKQIVEVADGLQKEEKDIKVAERKIRDLNAWIVNIDESLGEVNSGLVVMQNVADEVEKQKSTVSQRDSAVQNLGGIRSALTEVNQNTSQLNKATNRAEHKLQALQKEAVHSGAKTQTDIEHLHQQLLDAESRRVKVSNRSQRADAECNRLDREADAEASGQEQELAEIAITYGRLEKVVISHLQGLQKELLKGATLQPSQGHGHGQGRGHHTSLSMSGIGLNVALA